RDRPARLPARRPLIVGRADRRGPALLPREPGHPARRGAQVHRPRLPRAGRGPGAARLGPGPAARAARGEVGRRPALRGRMTRRIDLLGVEEVPPGTMKMAWASATEP